MQSTCKFSFILRFWRVEHTEAAAWMASLEIPETGKRIGFASLEQLFAYLFEITDTNAVGQKIGEIGKEVRYE